MITSISPQQAAEHLRTHPEAVLLDVRHPDAFAAGHLSGALSNCVFEVAFLARLGEMVARFTTPLVIYGESACSHEAMVAAEKALAAGYQQVWVIEGGRREWAAAGLPMEGGAPASPTIPTDGRWVVDTAESRIEWTGRNLVNKHWGTIGIASGELFLQGGLVTGGKIIIDMGSIRCTDLADSPLHDVLIAHLKDDDFFAVARHPQAQLGILSSRWKSDATPGSPGFSIEAELDLRGITRPVSLQAAAGVTADGRVAAQAAFSIDRTEWGVLYGSGKFFQFLAGHLVNDQIDLQVKVVADAETVHT